MRRDSLTVEQRSKTMARVRSKDTKPELFVRSLVHRMGYRFRLHRAELPGCPDLVFSGRQKVIFVHGCFWHSHSCEHGRKKPSDNSGYWNAKLARNKARDITNTNKLRKMGWDALALWECELKDERKLQARLRKFLESECHA